MVISFGEAVATVSPIYYCAGIATYRFACVASSARLGRDGHCQHCLRRESGLTLIMLLVLKLQSVKSEQKLRQQRECHRAAVDLVETLHAKLPFGSPT